MRAMAVAMLLTLGAFAGCVDVTPGALGPDAADPDADAESLAAARAALLEGAPEFCESETHGVSNAIFGEIGCAYWDDMYHEYVVYDLDTTILDVVIVPPAGMTTPDQIATSRLAVQAWSDGIEAMAAPWFAEGFQMNVYAVGVDVPSLDAVQDPEIVVISTSARGVAGIGLEPVQIGCSILGSETLASYPGHAHGDGRVLAENCAGLGFTCFAINGAGTDPRGLYDLIAHEVGHCLGAGHVGDAFDFRARYAPVHDIMSYQATPEQVHCVSNMNVRNLEGVYAHLLGRPEAEWLPAGSYMTFDPLDYAQVPCENPPGM